MQNILNYSIFANAVFNYLSAFGIFIGGVAVVYVFKKYILSRLKKWAVATETLIDDFLINAIEKFLIPIIYFGIFYVALHTLNLSENFKHGLGIATIILVTLLVVSAVISAVNFVLQSYLNKSLDSDSGAKQLKGISGLINFAIWMIALVFLLDNLGVKISAVVAGLGIGGIAVALAAQAVLGDLFSYFVIFFDKPFEVGDFIIIGDKMGVVEHVGIKTTRIRALGGEQLVFSNTDLTNSRVHNFKKMERRRVVFKLGVTYQTSSEKLKDIPNIVKDAIEAQKDATFDRGHFASYGDFSLNFEFVYYVTGADYNKYMDVQQAINLTVFEAFETEGIEFAYPTQTVFINKNQP
ncbi:MAG: mechanosensitive ion channel family protein [Methylotenera sp.]|jgi:small-conductance mechanosensitive channel|nr:mechanosensitive ion channel family protein [Methylotenera sp.]